METQTLTSDNLMYTYHSSYCFDLCVGELVYYITNAASKHDDADYERIM